MLPDPLRILILEDVPMDAELVEYELERAQANLELDGRLLTLCGRAGEPTHPLLGQRIDYILAGPGWQVGPSAVVHAGPSDHWPITAELTAVQPPARAGALRAAG